MKLLTTFFALLCVSFGTQMAQAQCVNEMNETEPGLYPDQLPDACVGNEYDQTIQFVVPTDTTINGFFTIEIDSAEIKNINGLPNGLSYSCHNSECKVVSGGGDVTHGCFRIEGTPTQALTSPNTVTIVVTLYGEGGFNGDIEYDVDFDSFNSGEGTCTEVGIDDFSQLQRSFAAYPNPAKQEIVRFSEEATNVKITAPSGELIYEGSSVYEYNTSGLKAGVYTVTADEGITRIVVQ